jgi:hypothetical protein
MECWGSSAVAVWCCCSLGTLLCTCLLHVYMCTNMYVCMIAYAAAVVFSLSVQTTESCAPAGSVINSSRIAAIIVGEHACSFLSSSF